MKYDTASEPARRTALLAISVVAMVGLAGCAGTGLGLPIGAPAPYTETGAALDGADLRANHLGALEAAGSYRSSFAMTIDGTDTAVLLNRSAAVDLAERESATTVRLEADTIEGDGLSVATYSTGNVTYRRIVADVGQQTVTRYDAARKPYSDAPLAVEPADPEAVAHATLIGPLVDDVNWTQRGVERYDGGWVTRYEAAGAENVSRLRGAAVDAGRVESADADVFGASRGLQVTDSNATLLVSPDGVVRYYHVHIDAAIGGQPVEMTLEGSTAGLGSTSVDGPDWLESAKDRTS